MSEAENQIRQAFIDKNNRIKELEALVKSQTDTITELESMRDDNAGMFHAPTVEGDHGEMLQ